MSHARVAIIADLFPAVRTGVARGTVATIGLLHALAILPDPRARRVCATGRGGRRRSGARGAAWLAAQAAPPRTIAVVLGNE